jgi:hypothetical protein
VIRSKCVATRWKKEHGAKVHYLRGAVEMLCHERLRTRVQVVHKHHGVVAKGLCREDLSERDQVRVRQLLPLFDNVHALCVDEAVAVDAAEADVRVCLHVGRLVHGRHVAKGVRLVQRVRGRRLQRAEVRKVVHFSGEIRI